MGFKQSVDLVPLLSVSPITPAGKQEYVKVFQVLRTDTVASVKVELPAQASLLSVVLFAGTASDAGTTAAVTVTMANNTGTISTGSGNVLTAGIGTNGGTVAMSALPNLEPLPLLGDLLISAVYAETGTASTVGGPFKFHVHYVA